MLTDGDVSDDLFIIFFSLSSAKSQPGAIPSLNRTLFATDEVMQAIEPATFCWQLISDWLLSSEDLTSLLFRFPFPSKYLFSFFSFKISI